MNIVLFFLMFFCDKLSPPPPRFVTILTASADMGNSTAQYGLSKLYATGIGMPHDSARAIMYLTAASKAGHIEATATLANRWGGGLEL